MPKKSKPILDKHGNLSLANCSATSVSVEDFDREGFEIVLPAVTFAIIEERDYEHEVLPEGMTEAQFLALDSDERKELIEKFQETSGFEEWRKSFEPMMLYYWPVALQYQTSGTTAAELFETLGIACSLLEITGDSLREVVGEDYAIVLTGGGMNLCDHLVAAYLACGCVPPTELLTSLKGVIGKRRLAQIAPRLKEAFDDATAWAAREVRSLKEHKAELFTGKRGGINTYA